MSRSSKPRNDARHNARVSSVWFQDLKEPAVRQKFDDAVKLSLEGAVAKRLKAIIEQRRREILTQERKDYDNLAWPYQQAHRNGQLDILQWAEDLLTLKYES